MADAIPRAIMTWRRTASDAHAESQAPTDRQTPLVVLLPGMSRLALAILVVSASPPLAAQTRDRTLERITLALEQPRSVISSAAIGEALRSDERRILGVPIFEPLPGAPKLGPFEFVAPQFRGEFIRLALPVGEYLSHGVRTLVDANRRRQERAARRRVEVDLQARQERASKQ